MGTRHLTCVVKDGEYKVAQYGQWDGYPSGQGVVVLNFLNQYRLDQFIRKLDNVEWISDEDLQGRWEEAGANPGDKWVGMDVSNKFGQMYPENSRDTGADILELIYNFEPTLTKPTLRIMNGIDFAGDSLFCEWAYVIDLDKKTLEVYKGFNETPLTEGERFFGFEGADGYEPIKLLKEWKLDELPDEVTFVSTLEPEDE